MFLRVCNSGSSANGYAIGNDKEVLLIEAGCSFKEMKQKVLNFRVDNIVGICISHEHGDHFKYHAEYSVAGIPLFMPFVSDGKYQQFGHFYIKAFELPHGDTKSYGFYIRHEEIGKMLFMTDFEYCPFDMSKLNVNHILIECNYQLNMVDMEAVNFEHKVRGHCSVDTACEFIRHNNSPELRSVCLLHTNWNTINEEQTIEKIKGIVDYDVEVIFARKGLIMELKMEAF
jgi:ribonuclease BN (tRNA processing enzyme)